MNKPLQKLSGPVYSACISAALRGNVSSYHTSAVAVGRLNNALFTSQQMHRNLCQCSHRPQQYQHPPAEDHTVEHVPTYYDRFIFPQPPDVVSEEEHNVITEQVNKSIIEAQSQRLFAVVLFASKQFKVTDHDLIRTTGYIDAELGEKIRLEKVLLVGGKDFTMLGRPLLKRSLVKVEAVVVEKTPGESKIIQRFTPKENFQRKYVYTGQHTVLRITCVEAYPDAE
uniref:Large ribosomal subunit protein bL21m n=1 Tax=Ciona savignyi TaxID=51511 RepID=H2Z4N1_CIOSA